MLWYFPLSGSYVTTLPLAEPWSAAQGRLTSSWNSWAPTWLLVHRRHSYHRHTWTMRGERYRKWDGKRQRGSSSPATTFALIIPWQHTPINPQTGRRNLASGMCESPWLLGWGCLHGGGPLMQGLFVNEPLRSTDCNPTLISLDALRQDYVWLSFCNLWNSIKLFSRSRAIFHFCFDVCCYMYSAWLSFTSHDVFLLSKVF